MVTSFPVAASWKRDAWGLGLWRGDGSRALVSCDKSMRSGARVGWGSQGGTSGDYSVHGGGVTSRCWLGAQLYIICLARSRLSVPCCKRILTDTTVP